MLGHFGTLGLKVVNCADGRLLPPPFPARGFGHAHRRPRRCRRRNLAQLLLLLDFPLQEFDLLRDFLEAQQNRFYVRLEWIEPGRVGALLGERSLRRFYPLDAFARAPILGVQDVLQILYLRIYFRWRNSSVEYLPLRFLARLEFGLGGQGILKLLLGVLVGILTAGCLLQQGRLVVALRGGREHLLLQKFQLLVEHLALCVRYLRLATPLIMLNVDVLNIGGLETAAIAAQIALVEHLRRDAGSVVLLEALMLLLRSCRRPRR